MSFPGTSGRKVFHIDPGTVGGHPWPWVCIATQESRAQVGCTYARALGISALHVLQLWTGSGFQGSKLYAKEQHEVMQAALEEQKWYASLHVPLNNMCYFKRFLSRHGVWVQRIVNATGRVGSTQLEKPSLFGKNLTGTFVFS